MKKQTDRADEEDDAEIAVWPIPPQDAAGSEQRSGQGCLNSHRQRFGHSDRQVHVQHVEDCAHHDANDHRVVEHRIQRVSDDCPVGQAFCARANQFHRRDAKAITKRRMQRDDGKVRTERVRAERAFGNGQTQQHGVREKAAKTDGD